MKEKTLLTSKEKFGFSAFSASTNIIFTFKNVYYLLFLTNVLNINVGTAGIMVAIGTIWDAVNDPILGLWAANHQFKSREQVRPLLFYASIPWAISIVLLFCDFKMTKAMTILLCLLVYFIFEACYTLVAIPYTAMPSLASSLDSDRKKINAFRGFGAGLGSGIGSVAVTPLVKLFGGLKGKNAIIGPQDQRALFLTAICMGSLCILGSMVHYFTSKERVKPQQEEKDKMSIFTAYKYLFGSKSWVLNACYFIFYCLNNVLTMTIVTYYASYVLKASSLTTLILAVYMVMYVTFSLLTPMLDRKMGRKKIMIASICAQLIGKIPFLLFPHSLITVMINSASMGIGGATIYVMANTNRNNISEILEIKHKRRMDAMLASGENLLVKLSEAGAQYFMTLALSIAGFQAELGPAQTPATLQTICLLIGWVPFIISILSLIVILNIDITKELETVQKSS